MVLSLSVDVSWVFDAPTNIQLLLFETTIGVFCYLGWRTAMGTYRKLTPILSMIERLPPERIQKAGAFLERKFKEWEQAERKLEEQGL